MPAEPSAPTGRRFGRLWRDSLICDTLKTRRIARAAMVIESVQSLLPSAGLKFVFFHWNLVFARMNLKPSVFKNFPCVPLAIKTIMIVLFKILLLFYFKVIRSSWLTLNEILIVSIAKGTQCSWLIVFPVFHCVSYSAEATIFRIW